MHSWNHAKLNLMLRLILKLHFPSTQTAIKTISGPFALHLEWAPTRKTKPPPPLSPGFFPFFLCTTLWSQIVWNAIKAAKLSSNGEPVLPGSVALATCAQNTASSSFATLSAKCTIELQTSPLSAGARQAGRRAGRRGGGWTAVCILLAVKYLSHKPSNAPWCTLMCGWGPDFKDPLKGWRVFGKLWLCGAPPVPALRDREKRGFVNSLQSQDRVD